MPQTTPLKRYVVALGVSALLAPAGLLAVADAATTKTVSLKGVQFSPRSVSIHKNDRIRFKWAGGTHNLIGPKANVGPQSSGSRTIQFTRKGTYKYMCTLHANMTTVITVR